MTQSNVGTTRIEQDALGSMELESGISYGIQTARAVQNFSISGKTIADVPYLVASIIDVKQAAAVANERIGVLAPEISLGVQWATRQARQRIDAGTFPVDVYHGGGGTSANMNVNEVLAHLANAWLSKADKQAIVHPNDHVNLGQSTNDVIPSAMKIATFMHLGELEASLVHVVRVLSDKEAEFEGVVKLGRTCLQDALPVTLGQQFSGYRSAVERQIDELRRVQRLCLELPLGATAVGTQFGTSRGYVTAVYESLEAITGIPFRKEPNFFDGLQNADVWLSISSVLKAIASVLNKLSSDLRLMSSGPRAGLAEIELPAVQPGSSIMPGKVNPVIPEMIMQVYFRVLGNDLVVARACEGELDLNVWESVIIASISESITLLAESSLLLADRCVLGIKVNVERCLQNARESLAMSTVVAALHGYKTASAVAREAASRQATIEQVVVESGLMTERDAQQYLDPALLTEPHRFHEVFASPKGREIAHLSRNEGRE